MKRILLCGLALFMSHAYANSTRLPVPKNLVAYDSKAGYELLENAPYKYDHDFWKLSQYFVTEKGLTFCGPASIVMVLNALNKTPTVPAPGHYPYELYTQDNIFNNTTILDHHISPAVVGMHGLSLAQVGYVLKQYVPDVKVYYSSNIKTVSQLRSILLSALEANSSYIIVNFARKGFNEIGGGHFSPIVAYSPATDRFLVMDVARYKYPPVWVKAKTLLTATQDIDSGNHKSRGFIVVSTS